MAQNATLDGTSDRGGWVNESAGTSNIHLSADGTSAGSDYIQGEIGFDGAPAGPAIFTLSDVTDPESAADHKIIYTALATAGGFMGTPGLTIALFEGTTQRHSTTNIVLTQAALLNTQSILVPVKQTVYQTTAI